MHFMVFVFCGVLHVLFDDVSSGDVVIAVCWSRALYISLKIYGHGESGNFGIPTTLASCKVVRQSPN